MTSKWILAASTAAILLAGCESGDINIDPSTNVNNPPSGGGNGGGTDNPCASYVNSAGQTIQGTFEDPHCRYSSSFVDSGNNLMVDMTIPDLDNDGAHIFDGSLFVGGAYNSDAELQAAGIAEGGDGPQLTIEAGATLAFASQSEFMVINRGSQIIAVGTPDAPITITSVSDVEGTVGPEDVQQWGGLVIDGFGVTNKCVYTGTVAGGDLALDGECHVPSEGSAGIDENYYGGDNNADSSGRLEYFIVKHTGAEVGNGDELNGITFSGVGSGTVVSNLEVYSVYDDGIEFFGGAVNVDNYLAMYVRDDSIDIDEGYAGTITNALVVQALGDGNHCIEADGIGSYSGLDQARRDEIIAQGINSRPTINHLTCIISQHPEADGTHGAGAGWRFREGIFPVVNDSMIVASFGANDEGSASDNYCIRIDNNETQQGALDGDLALNSVIFACAERTDTADPWAVDGATTTEGFVTDGGNVFATIASGTAVNPTAAADEDLQLLEGTQPVYSIDWATSMVDGAAPAATTEPTDDSGFLGGLSQSETDWTQPWTYGLNPDNRAQPLWFEAE